MIEHLMRTGIGYMARKKRSKRKMRKRNYHKVSKISVKKKKRNKHLVHKRIRNERLKKNAITGMKANSYARNYG
jgi:hypothetical protein